MLPSQFKQLMATLGALSNTLRESKDAAKEQITAIQNTARASDEKRREIPRVIASAIKAAHEDVPTYEKSQRYQEYTQQNRLVWATWFTFGATLLAFGAAAIYAGIAAKQLRVSRQQLQQLIDAERPWVAFIPSKRDVKDDDAASGDHVIERERKGGNPKAASDVVQYRLINYGKSPAQVMVWANIGDNTPYSEWTKDTDTACSKAANMFKSGLHPITAIPGNPVAYSITHNGKESHGEEEYGPLIIRSKSPQKACGNDGRGQVLGIRGCIIYQSTIHPADRPYQTPFRAELCMQSDGTWGTAGPWVVGGAQ